MKYCDGGLVQENLLMVWTSGIEGEKKNILLICYYSSGC